MGHQVPGQMVACKWTGHLVLKWTAGANETQGTSDQVYSFASAEEGIKYLLNSPDARLVKVEGGQHFLSASHPEMVAEHLLEFVGKHSK